ncbi:MAG TPA: hypothetical protein VLB86_14785 [Gaiellaceae bacterium]|nr:hypothetical protein [Gaiellaceae bacterium]
MSARARATLAGATAAAVWALQEPLDRRVFGVDYSDPRLLGRLAGRGARAGLAIHVANGAGFGIAFAEIRRRTPVAPRRLALGLALAEHVALWPLIGVVESRALATSPRAFAQATWRHALFGWVLGRLAVPRPR